MYVQVWVTFLRLEIFTKTEIVSFLVHDFRYLMFQSEINFHYDISRNIDIAFKKSLVIKEWMNLELNFFIIFLRIEIDQVSGKHTTMAYVQITFYIEYRYLIQSKDNIRTIQGSSYIVLTLVSKIQSWYTRKLDHEYMLL